MGFAEIKFLVLHEVLERFIIPQLQEISNIIFQLDSVPPHWSLDLRDCLDKHFSESWIWRDGRIRWPARSPDLTPCNFFMWGFMKHETYNKINSLKEPRENITEALLQLSREVLENSWMDLDQCLNIVIIIFIRWNNQ